jgi:Bardet-Biedl syndrome 7 protein
MHEWLSKTLPDMPARAAGGEVSLLHENTFTGTRLRSTWSKGRAEFLSDSATTLSILYESLTRAATAVKLGVDMDIDVSKDATDGVLLRLAPELNATLALSRQMELLEALREIRTGDDSFLSDAHRAILEEADTIKRRARDRPQLLEMLFGVITDLYIDVHKFKGRSVSHRCPELMELLSRDEEAGVDLEAVARFFVEAT